jgi:YVTN family beta-propeller protein
MYRMKVRVVLRACLGIASLFVVAALIAPLSVAAQTASAGHVYVLNNDIMGENSITVFARAANGALSPQTSIHIGGRGNLPAFADGTQGSLIITPDGQRLFAADAGSDQISVIDVHDGQLTVANVSGSAGSEPISLTYGGGFLYVLNAANASDAPASVAGFTVDAAGGLHTIPGAIKSLSTAHPNPAQVLLDPTRRVLVVTEKRTNLIDVFQVAGDGSLSGPKLVNSIGLYPFSMAFGQGPLQSELIVDDGFGPGVPTGTGAVTTYSVTNGLLKELQGPVFDHQIAPCWMVLTRDGRFAYTSNADSQAISGFRIQPDGTIGLLNADGVTATTPSDTFPIEESLSRDGGFLYVLDSRLLLARPGAATLSGFAIGPAGQLTPVVDPALVALPFSAIGIAAD